MTKSVFRSIANLIRALRSSLRGAYWRRDPRSAGAWAFVVDEFTGASPHDVDLVVELAEKAFRADADAPTVILGLARCGENPAALRLVPVLFDRLTPTKRVALRCELRAALLHDGYQSSLHAEESALACAQILGWRLALEDPDDRVWVKAGYPLFTPDGVLSMRNSTDTRIQIRAIAIWIAIDRVYYHSEGRAELVRRFFKHQNEISTHAIKSLINIRRGLGLDVHPPRPLVRLLAWRTFVEREALAASLLYSLPGHWLTNSFDGWGQVESEALWAARRDAENIPPFFQERFAGVLVTT